MGTNWAIEKAEMAKNDIFIKKAEALMPQLYRTQEEPTKYAEYTSSKIRKNPDMEDEKMTEKTVKGCYGKGDRIVFDFGHNRAAYFQFDINSVGSPQDAPVFLHIKFCEIKNEISEESVNYNGWISKGWIQEEWMHIDETPHHIEMERRYAFRYAVITVIDTSQKFQISFQNVKRFAVSSVSSVERKAVPSIQTTDRMLKKIDETAIRTLENCMQTVFEDGPKRDRRLWLGDIRLQALVNYSTFQNQELVKRCLYLFAGMPNQDGMIPACIFEKPVPLMDDTFLLDYALFMLPVLVEYYQNTGDRETLEELAPSALHQIQLALAFTDADGLVIEEGIDRGKGAYHCFIDWNEALDKQCAMQAVLIYALGYAEKLCGILGDNERIALYTWNRAKLTHAAMCGFWDTTQQVFVSGKGKQVSLASQVWMILAGVIAKKDASNVLQRATKASPAMVTPYMHHFYVTSLIQAGESAQALNHIKKYWGGMIQAGADTFWELYNPENENESPYGGSCVNSYCHAWSCTPAYLLREFF